jgi:hypothetical protein
MPPLARFLAVIAVAGLAAASFGAEPAPVEQAGPNLVKNPGFQEDAPPWQLPAGFEVVKDAGRAGGACLHFVRTDASTYRLASQSIECRPGRRYRFSAWVRTKGVAGGDSGATVCMEWSGAKGWIGGAYPVGRKGDNDWFRVEGVTAPLPPEATSMGVRLYLRKGMTGEAWFDDVEVSEFWGRPIEAYLAHPAYRGLIFDVEPRVPVRVRVELADLIEGHAWRPEGGYAGLSDLALVCRLVADGKPVAETRHEKLAARTLEMEVASAPLKAGPYEVEVVLRQGRRDIASQRLGGQVLPAGQRPRVYIDRYRRTMVDGKPFLPLGFYFGNLQEADMAKMAEAGFNCAMPYAFSGLALEKAAAALDMAQRHGVKVIYSVKDLYAGTKHFPAARAGGPLDADAAVAAIVERFRSHPNVLAWYLNDELPATMRGELEARYRLVRRLDPDHPTWAVLYQVDELPDYRHTCDVLGTDPYPLPDKPVTMAADWAMKTGRATGGACAFWQVPQAFDWANYHKTEEPAKHRPPTYEELRTMTYLALINGAKGLIYYSFYDLQRDRLGFDTRWKDVSRVGREVQGLAPAILAIDPLPAGFKVDGPRWAAMRQGAHLWVLVTNPEREAVAMRLTLPAGAGAAKTLAGREVVAKDGVVAEDFKPLACETYVIELR